MDFEGLKGKTGEETSAAIDLALSDISAEMMEIESWDFETAIRFTRRAYLIGSIAGAEYFYHRLREISNSSYRQEI